jgi:hypothetical protein
MTDDELREWRRKLIDDERKNPPGWWYLSFVSDDDVFLGVAIVQGQGLITAVRRAHRLKINPGGQLMGLEIPDISLVPEEARERLLSKADLERLLGPVRRLGDIEDMDSE